MINLNLLLCFKVKSHQYDQQVLLFGQNCLSLSPIVHVCYDCKSNFDN